MTRKGVSKEELQLAKNYMAGSFARSLEDPRTIARFALNTYLNDLPQDHYATYLKRLDTVTVDGVLHAARALLVPDQATILVVGDKESLYNRLTQLSFDQRVFQFDEDGSPYREKLEGAPAGVTANTVLDAYFKALGGREAVEKVRSVKMVLSGSRGDKPVTITRYNAEPNKYASETVVDGRLEEKVVLDGARAQRIGEEGTEEIIEMELEDLIQAAAPFPELHYNDLGIRPVLSGIADVGGRKAYKLTIATDNGGVYFDYFDVETGMKVRHEERRAYDASGITVVTDYQDMRPEGGIMFPHLIVEKKLSTVAYAVSEITVNGRIDASVFTVD